MAATLPAMNRDVVGPSAEWRQPLYAGVLGCLGVALAWLLWVAVHAFAKSSWQVLVAPVVGAVVGMVMEFFRRHVLVSAREAHEPATDNPVISDDVRRRVREEPAYGKRSSSLAAAGLFAGLFLFSICSNLVGDLMIRLVEPFFATLALFFPIGVWLGFVFRERSTFDTWPHSLGRGLLAGAGAAVIAFVVSLALGLTDLTFASLLGFMGWWVLVGLGWGIAYMECYGPRPFAPIAGTAIAALFLSVSTAPRSSSGNLWENLRYVTDPLSSYALAQPGLPSRFWDEAVNELNARQPSEGSQEGPAPELDLRRQASVRLPARYGSDSAAERSRVLAAQLEEGLESELARSWLIIALFSVTVGFGRWSEARLRPLDYGRSETRRNDLYLTCGAMAVWLGAVLFIAIRGW